MKITESSINHNAMRLIKFEASNWMWDEPEKESTKVMALMALVKIEGICQLAEELKKVINE